MKQNFFEKNNIQTPSKKILMFLGAIVLFFVAFFGYGPVSHVVKNVDLRGNLTYNGALGANSIESAVDTDKDGLMDWQEVLWKTDPNNPDTDGDGTKDGDEVAAGRDPTKPGPDDKITHSLELTASADGGSSIDPNNISTQLAQSLFAQFMAQGGAQDGTDIDQTTQTQIINNTLSNLKPEVIPTRYTIGDIKVINSQNTATTKAFGNSFMKIHQDMYASITPATSNDQAIATYSQLADQLSNIEVPGTLVLDYLALLNNYYALSELSKIMLQSTDDPVKVLLAIKSNQDLDAKNQDIYQRFADYFKNNGIIWDNNEPGHAWNNF